MSDLLAGDARKMNAVVGRGQQRIRLQKQSGQFIGAKTLYHKKKNR